MRKRIIYNIVLSVLLCCPVSMFADKEVSYLADIDIRDESISKRNGEGIVDISMTIDLSRSRIRTQHTVALTPVLVSADGSKEQAFSPVIIDGGTRNRIYLRSQVMKSVEAPVYHEDGAQRVIIRRKNHSEQVYEYTASLPYASWMLDGRIEMREEVHGCVNCAQGESSSPLMEGSDVLPAYIPEYRTCRIAPEPEPVKERDETRSARLQFKWDNYRILPDFKDNRSVLDTVSNSIRLVQQDSDLEIIGIYITGYASPEGTVAYNQKLSENRARALAGWISKNEGIDIDMITVEWGGEDWKGFRSEVEALDDLQKKEEVLGIMDRSAGDWDATEKEIIRLRPSAIYKRLLREVYPYLRHNDYSIKYRVRNFDLEEARKVLKTRPERLSLSEIYMVAGSYGKGSPEYDEAMAVAARMYPDRPCVVNDLALDAMEAGDYGNAVAILEGAEPQKNPQLLNTLGVAYAKAGDPRKGEKTLVEAAEAGCEEAWYNLVEVRAVIDQLDD